MLGVVGCGWATPWRTELLACPQGSAVALCRLVRGYAAPSRVVGVVGVVQICDLDRCGRDSWCGGGSRAELSTLGPPARSVDDG